MRKTRAETTLAICLFPCCLFEHVRGCSKFSLHVAFLPVGIVVHRNKKPAATRMCVTAGNRRLSRRVKRHPRRSGRFAAGLLAVGTTLLRHFAAGLRATRGALLGGRAARLLAFRTALGALVGATGLLAVGTTCRALGTTGHLAIGSARLGAGPVAATRRRVFTAAQACRHSHRQYQTQTHSHQRLHHEFLLQSASSTTIGSSPSKRDITSDLCHLICPQSSFA